MRTDQTKKRLNVLSTDIRIMQTLMQQRINESDNVVLLQRIVNKIEHKFEHCERFLSDNQNNIKLSYYTEGYYNGRARAFEDVIDFISDTIEKAYNEQYK